MVCTHSSPICSNCGKVYWKRMTGKTLTSKNPAKVNQMEADGVRLFKSKAQQEKGAKKQASAERAPQEQAKIPDDDHESQVLVEQELQKADDPDLALLVKLQDDIKALRAKMELARNSIPDAVRLEIGDYVKHRVDREVAARSQLSDQEKEETKKAVISDVFAAAANHFHQMCVASMEEAEQKIADMVVERLTDILKKDLINRILTENPGLLRSAFTKAMFGQP